MCTAVSSFTKSEKERHSPPLAGSDCLVGIHRTFQVRVHRDLVSELFLARLASSGGVM